MQTWGKWAAAGVLWLAALKWAKENEFALVFLTLTGIAMIFLNLGERKGASAYSIFNKKCRSLLGTLDGKALEAQFTHRDYSPEPSSPLAQVAPDNRLRNKPCPCGSGKKHKKCCLGKHAEGEEDYWQ